jgi:hypothetical protein
MFHGKSETGICMHYGVVQIWKLFVGQELQRFDENEMIAGTRFNM